MGSPRRAESPDDHSNGGISIPEQGEWSNCGENVLGVPVLLGVNGWDQVCKLDLDIDELQALQQAAKAISDATIACRGK